MSSVEQKLSAYAAYHRDARNVFAHLIGIPVIILAVAVLLSRPGFAAGGVVLTPAMLVSALAAVFYLRLDLGLGIVMVVLLGAACWAGLALGNLPPAAWLTVGVGLFVLGWVIQFIGHGFEGRKPAFFDDLTSLAIGPVFVVAEVFVWLGWRRAPKPGVLASRVKNR
jgi:uncharacterized membrane protein YGL010W